MAVTQQTLKFAPNIADVLESETNATVRKPRKRYNIAMVSDFFYPNVGGVENHIYSLSQCLIKRGHKVIVITHFAGRRHGIRYLTNGLKAYYIPHTPFYNSNSFPTFYLSLPLIRQILLRERIDIVHCHQAFSTLGLESLVHCSMMGYKTCFTDHSLFGFADASSIHMNKLLKFTLSDVDHVICVSHTSKENTVLRSQIDPENISVIPNAIDSNNFTTNPSARPTDKINIVVISRLVYRKGIDLLIAVIPEICRRFPNVNWIIGGDGPKRLELEEMRERHQLHDRVELLGSVRHHQVRDVLVRGHIFVNSSLTEAFCIAIVEAASCGLLVVATRVGGVPEVLPNHMIKLCEPNPEDLMHAITESIPLVKDVVPDKFHEEIRRMYNWHDIAERTERVYDRISRSQPLPLVDRLAKYYGCGEFAGKIFCLTVVLNYLLWLFIEWLWPREDIDPAVDFPTDQLKKK